VNFWIQMGITIVKGVLTEIHFDPSKATIYKTVLLDLANGIYVVFGLTPPTPPAAS